MALTIRTGGANAETSPVEFEPAHPEGLRERPDEVPATAASIQRGPGANSARSESRAGKDERGQPLSTVAPEKQTLREGAFGHAKALSCRECGHLTELGPYYACPECFGPLEIAYDFPQVTRAEIESGPRNIWRYKALLPVPSDIEQSPNMEPGFTRLLKAHNLGRELGIDNLWVKDDSTNPTNSFKDRVVACALSAARELDAKVFACPSTGNLANAVAAAGARAGIKTVVFIPSDLEQPKQVNSAVYTDSLVAVNGNYDDVNKLASEIAGEEEGWAFVNVNVRPFYAEGSKTLGYEIAEQLGWLLPGLGRLQGRPRRHRPGQARHDRQEPGDRQPRRRHLRARHLPPDRRG